MFLEHKFSILRPGPDFPICIMGTGLGAHAHLGPKWGEEKKIGSFFTLSANSAFVGKHYLQ